MMMLARQGVLSDAEKEDIIAGLQGIRSDVEKGNWRLQTNMRTFTALWRQS